MTPWWLNFLVAITAGVAFVSALGWQLWRRRRDENLSAGSQYFEDKVRSEMQPARCEGMTVADLIHLLQQQVPAATVVLWDQPPYEGQVAKLGVGEVQPIQLGARESNGILLFEPWVIGDDELEGPFAGVVIGSNSGC